MDPISPTSTRKRLDIYDVAAGQPWAILPETLDLILQICSRDNDLRAVQERLGRPLEYTRTSTVRKMDKVNVAVVPVAGPIVRYAGMFTEISGATSAEQLAQELTSIAADPTIHAVVLDVDSPGGSVSGIRDTAHVIRGVAQQKPLVAYISDLGASAAYWLAAAADGVAASETARVGSIGVVAVIQDARERESKAGIRTHEIVSSQSRNKRPDVATDEGRAQIQALVDKLADVFVGDVAAFRGVPVEKVLSDFGQGGVFVGRDAKAAGLIDDVGTFEETLADVAAQASARLR